MQIVDGQEERFNYSCHLQFSELGSVIGKFLEEFTTLAVLSYQIHIVWRLVCLVVFDDVWVV